MPELPEVHTIVSDLKKHVKGAVIESVQISERFKGAQYPSLLIESLTNRKITAVKRIAKNIIFVLDSQDLLVIHLAMTGQLLFRKPRTKKDPWTRATFSLRKDGKLGKLRYCDMRMFGKIAFYKKGELENLSAKYGPDPFDKNLDAEKLMGKVKSKNTNIKNALLDQSLISGVGNIYANEALWAAKIHPKAKTLDLTIPMSKNLLKALREVLTEAISNRGSTLKDKMYLDIFGKAGNHQDYFTIYGKEECPRCNIPIKFEKLNGRGTYFCDNCQEKDGQIKLL